MLQTQVAKYIGASLLINTIIIAGYDENRDICNMMSQNTALLLYYLLEGYKIRQQEFNQTESLQKYTVLPENSTRELVFVEDQRSGRWWIELYSDAAEKDVKMACTRKDYEEACNNHISDRLTALLALT